MNFPCEEPGTHVLNQGARNVESKTSTPSWLIPGVVNRTKPNEKLIQTALVQLIAEVIELLSSDYVRFDYVRLPNQSAIEHNRTEHNPNSGVRLLNQPNRSNKTGNKNIDKHCDLTTIEF